MKLFRELFAPILDEPDSLFGSEDNLTTEEVIDLLIEGEPVEVDLKRFAGNPTNALIEQEAVRGLADQGNPVAKQYLAKMEPMLQSFTSKLAQMQRALAPPGAQGQAGQQGGMMGNPMMGGPGGGALGQAMQTPMPSMLPPNAMTMQGADMMSAVPTEPLPVGMQ